MGLKCDVNRRGKPVQTTELTVSRLLRDGAWAIMESRRLCKTAGLLLRETRERHRRHRENQLQELIVLSGATDAFSRRRRAIVARLARERSARSTERSPAA